jgi:hypothetical protein
MQMHFRTAIAAGALVLAPALALAAEPMLVKIDGQVVPIEGHTHVIQTAAGPAHVSTWSWHSPNGSGMIEVQSSTGGAPPAWALQQMRDMQSQMLLMQQQIQQIQHASLNQMLVVPQPLTVLFVPSVPMFEAVPASTPDTVHPATPLHRISPSPIPQTPGVKA